MSQPTFPSLSPSITREEAVNQIISSIAYEELGLSHIINTEGEKLQYIIGTIPGATGPAATVEDVLAANDSVKSTLDAISQNQLLYKSKLQTVLAASPLTGPTGPTGANFTTTTSFAANTTTGTPLAVVTAGISIPLPDNQVLPAGITVNGTNTVFTVATAGRYRISYSVNLTAGVLLGTRILVNSNPVAASSINAVLSLSNYKAEFITDLTAGSTVELQLFGATVSATLLTGSGSQGAALMIMRLS